MVKNPPMYIFADRGPRGGLIYREKRMPDTIATYVRTDLVQRTKDVAGIPSKASTEEPPKMTDFGDGREERMDAFDLELRLRGNPEITRRKAAYDEAVRKARAHAETLPKDQIIARLMKHCPAYIPELLETEDARIYPGALAERYARTFYRDFK